MTLDHAVLQHALRRCGITAVVHHLDGDLVVTLFSQADVTEVAERLLRTVPLPSEEPVRVEMAPPPNTWPIPLIEHQVARPPLMSQRPVGDNVRCPYVEGHEPPGGESLLWMAHQSSLSRCPHPRGHAPA